MEQRLRYGVKARVDHVYDLYGRLSAWTGIS